jgi:tetratricopeptide (TPR) repeat protein
MQKIKASAGASYFVAARIGWLAYLAGRFADSVAAYREAAQLAPAAVEPRLGMTLPLLAQKSWRELETACRDVLKLDPNNGAARARLAHAHYSIGNYPDAAVVYRKLMDEYPAELDHQTGLGWALARMGRVKEAKAIFSAVLAVSPDNWNAQQGMALP